MFVDYYQVEIRNSATGNWRMERRFRPRYRWHQVVGRIFRKRSQSDIQTVLAVGNALQYARHTFHISMPRSVRLVRIELEKIRRVKFVIWIDGTWCE